MGTFLLSFPGDIIKEFQQSEMSGIADCNALNRRNNTRSETLSQACLHRYSPNTRGRSRSSTAFQLPEPPPSRIVGA